MPTHVTHADRAYTQSHRPAGTGVGVNLQVVRKAGHWRAADLAVGTWVLVGFRERTRVTGKLWLKRCVVVVEWRQSYRKQAVLQGRSGGIFMARGTHLQN